MSKGKQYRFLSTPLKPVKQQAELLRRYFPGLDTSHVGKLARRLRVRRGWAVGVWPKFSAVLKMPAAPEEQRDCVACYQPSWPAFNRALHRLKHLLQQFGHRNFTVNAVSEYPQSIRLVVQTAEAYAQLEASIPGDVVVLPVQLGPRHWEETPIAASAALSHAEFLLDPFAVGSLILTHRERFHNARTNWLILCAGSDRTDPLGSTAFADAPLWCADKRCGGRVEFGSHPLHIDLFGGGVASAILPR